MGRSTKEEFESRAKLVHENKYDYSAVEYVSSKKCVKIACLIHGLFEQTPDTHLRGGGCPKCGKEKRAQAQSLSQDEFLERAIRVHGDLYDYTRVNYCGMNSKIIIVCPMHGEFLKRPVKHLIGQGCPRCGRDRGAKKIARSTEQFVDICKKVHSNKYDYSVSRYTRKSDNVSIVCPLHGAFQQRAGKHLSGHGCPKCEGGVSYTRDEFVLNAKIAHGDKYDYSLVEYKNSQTKVVIVCPLHGRFSQIPNSHIQGCGCPHCVTSKQEERISKFLSDNNIKHERQKKFGEHISVRNHRFDFYLPEFNTCIEYDGEFHFHSFNGLGGERTLQITKRNDEIKNKFCKENGINLLRIDYKQKNKIEQILEEFFQRL